MAIVQLSYLKLLKEISAKLGIQTPQCEVTLVCKGWFVAYIEFEVVRFGSIVETLRCWGGPSPDMQEAKEEAAGSTVRRMKDEFGLEIKDVNYDDFILYRNMYDQVSLQHTNIKANFNNLEREYNILRSRYTSTLAQNSTLLAERAKMRSIIDEYHATVNRLRRGCSVSTADPSDESSG